MTSTTTIYAHPDGHEITVGHGLITACTSEGTAVSLPIGPDGLAALGAALLEHADSAAGGFAGAIVNVLELGIASLPQFDEGADK